MLIISRWHAGQSENASTQARTHVYMHAQTDNLKTMYKICNTNDILIKLKNVARPMLQTLEAPIFDSIVHKLKHTITKLTNRIAEVYTSSNLRLRKILKVED